MRDPSNAISRQTEIKEERETIKYNRKYHKRYSMKTEEVK